MATTRRTVFPWPRDGREEDSLAIEEPLEIRADSGSVAVTMRTPGHDRELAAGFLLTEGVIDGLDDLLALAHLPGDPDNNTIIARLAGGVDAHREALSRATRELYATSSCGICGKSSIDRIRILAAPVQPPPPIPPEVWISLPALLRGEQTGFVKTGGLHGAALVTFDGELEIAREDVGRHNAVDKIAGWIYRHGVDPSDKILYTTGRLTSEMVIKTVRMGIPILVSRSGFTA